MESLRTFVAIELEEELHRELAKVQSSLKDKIPQNRVRWIDPEGIHLTLKFLGQVPKDQVPDIVAALERARQGVSSFHLTIRGLGCFPSLTNPRVIWVGVQAADESLTRLHSQLEKEMASLGYPPEGRPFNAHLTLGRVRENAQGGARRALGEVISATAVGELGRIQVRSISLMQSILHPTGAKYIRLASIPLSG